MARTFFVREGSCHTVDKKSVARRENAREREPRAQVGGPQCETPATVMHDNAYFTTTGEMTECKTSLEDWQKQGHELNSTVASIPADDTIIAWAKELLQF